MANKIRKQIYIDAAQEERLKHIAAVTGESEAAIIRRAIDAVTTTRGAHIHHPVSSPDAWRRAVEQMRRSKLVPRPGVNIFDRDSMHER